MLKKTHEMLVGFKLGLVKVNVQAYPDDIVLLSPTSGDLRRFVEILRDLILDADLVANLEKTVIFFILLVNTMVQILVSICMT